jgi:hypothetical protein
MKTQANPTRWILLAAVSAIPMAVALPSAQAQYRVDNSRTNDANNRIGSGGYNDAASQFRNAASGNDIILNNSTGLSGFHGNVPYRAPGAFEGNLPNSPSDNLNRLSGGGNQASTPYDPTPRTYFSERQYQPPPAGFVQTGMAHMGYLEGPPPTRQPGDLRMGDIYPNTPISLLPKPGELALPGQVDPTAAANPDIFTNSSSLYGIRQFRLGEDNQTISTLGTPINYSTTTFGSGTLSEDEILRRRQSLNGSVLPENGTNGTNGGANESGNENSGPLGANAGGTSLSPTALNNGQIQPKQIVNTPLPPLAAGSGQSVTPASGDMSTGQQTRQVLGNLPSAAQQSPQYAQLQRKLAEYNAAHPKSDEEANRLFQDQLRARRQLIGGSGNNNGLGPTGPGGGVAPTIPGGGGTATPPGGVKPTPQLPPSQTVKPAEPIKPVDINSIGGGMTAPGIADLVKQGEDLSKQQKFGDAVRKFQDAAMVAPNNGLVRIGLANAELGASMYDRCERDLRSAFIADPALLMGRYDLKTMIGDERLQVIIVDLKNLANSTQNSTPVFLLAYITYNTGDTTKAADYLDLAETRADGRDALIKDLRDHWQLKSGSTTQPADLNK